MNIGDRVIVKGNFDNIQSYDKGMGIPLGDKYSGITGTITKKRNNKYAINVVMGKTAWYNENELEIVKQNTNQTL